LAKYRNTTSPLEKDKSSKAIQMPGVAAEIGLSVPDEQMFLRSTFYCPFCRFDEEAGPKKLPIATGMYCPPTLQIVDHAIRRPCSHKLREQDEDMTRIHSLT
jgi:hypothetical protein